MQRAAKFSFLLLLILSFGLPGRAQVASKDLAIAANPSAPSASSVEIFSSASLAGSQLHADPPELVEQSDGTGFVREFVNVRWRPGDDIHLYVVRPKNVQRPPLVIYLYGYPSETDRYLDDGWCQRVISGGYAAAGFVPALTGQRYHGRPMKEWFVSEMQESLASSAHDVQMILNYLAQRGDLDVERVGMFGVGAGGTIAIMASSVDSRIKAIDLLDPWGDWPVWMEKSGIIPDEERPDYVKPEFLNKIAAFDPVVLLPKVKAPRIRLTQLTEDSDSTPEQAKKHMASVLPASGEANNYESNAEYYGAVASGGRVFDWLKTQLKTAAKVADNEPAAGRRQGGPAAK